MRQRDNKRPVRARVAANPAQEGHSRLRVISAPAQVLTSIVKAAPYRKNDAMKVLVQTKPERRRVKNAFIRAFYTARVTSSGSGGRLLLRFATESKSRTSLPSAQTVSTLAGRGARAAPAGSLAGESQIAIFLLGSNEQQLILGCALCLRTACAHRHDQRNHAVDPTCGLLLVGLQLFLSIGRHRHGGGVPSQARVRFTRSSPLTIASSVNSTLDGIHRSEPASLRKPCG